MFLDEDEARTKWCPLARTTVEVKNEYGSTLAVGSANQLPDNKRPMCLTRSCMAWRGTSGPEGKSVGYCGAFGRPA